MLFGCCNNAVIKLPRLSFERIIKMMLTTIDDLQKSRVCELKASQFDGLGAKE